MPPLALCHVVRTSVLLGPERVTQALKIILTSSALEETTHARSTLCPGLDEPTREDGYHRKPTGNPTGYVASQEYTLFPEHIFLDNGVSGSRLDRPALDRLRDQARLGEFEAVIILSPDRLARSYPHQWVLLEELKKVGCRVIFLANPFGDSPHGQLLAQMQGMIAEYERSQITERTRRGRLHKARKAEFMPWAYRIYGLWLSQLAPTAGSLPGGDPQNGRRGTRDIWLVAP